MGMKGQDFLYIGLGAAAIYAAYKIMNKDGGLITALDSAGDVISTAGDTANSYIDLLNVDKAFDAGKDSGAGDWLADKLGGTWVGNWIGGGDTSSKEPEPNWFTNDDGTHTITQAARDNAIVYTGSNLSKKKGIPLTKTQIDAKRIAFKDSQAAAVKKGIEMAKANIKKQTSNTYRTGTKIVTSTTGNFGKSPYTGKTITRRIVVK